MTFGLKVNYEKTKVLWVGLAQKKKVTITDLTSVSKVNNFIYKSQLKIETFTPIKSQEKWLRDVQVENVSDIYWNEALAMKK